MIPKQLLELQKHFQKFPQIGPRQASRFSFFLLKQPVETIDNLIKALTALKNEVNTCKNCFLPTNYSSMLCDICKDTKRNKGSIYIIEKESDAINIEKINLHNGVYFILSENISPIGKSEIAKNRIKILIKKLKMRDDALEVILALNNTREGNFTSLYIQELFKKNLEKSNIKITRLGRGLSTGSELEYADEETLRNALKNRG